MNKVVTINLNGVAYQLEESGYEALRAYLDTAGGRLEGNPDRDEIIADIEQAIADKFRGLLGAYKTVVAAREVETIIAEMGPVEDASAPTGEAPPAAGSPRPGPKAAGPRRLFRIREGAMCGGVCNGIAAYLNLDVTLVRLLFVVVAGITFGAGAVAYLLLVLVVPAAETAAEKAAASGSPSTAREFIRRAREGYYEGVKSFADHRAHREWRRRFKREMRGWQRTIREEMSAGAQSWQQHWQRRWAAPPRADLTLAFTLPVLAVVRAVLICLALSAVVSLLATGALFGVLLPAGLPVWAAIVLLFVLYKLVTWPIRALRRACCWNGAVGWGPGHALLGTWDALVGVGLAVLLVWLAWHHAGQIRVAIAGIPPACRQAAEAVGRWWRAR